MIRENFDRESAILERDFAGLLYGYGGKTAGLQLQQALIERRGVGSVMKTPPYFGIDRGPYEHFEEVVNSRGGAAVFDDTHWRRPEGFEKKVLTPKLRREIVAVIVEMLRVFRQRGIRVNPDTLFHVRSSVDREDFRDDRHWGVFATHSGVPFFRGFNFGKGKASFAEQAIISLFARLYQLKQDPAYCLPENTGMGVTVQLTANTAKKTGYVIIAYSSYPEPEFSDEPVWEVYRMPRGAWFDDKLLGSPEPLTLSFMHYQLVFGGKEMVPGYYLEPEKVHPERVGQFWYWEGIKALKKGYLSKRRSDLLAKVLKGFAEELGYPVNLEIRITSPKSPFLHSVQLRPVPVLHPARPVRELEPLKPDEVLLVRTPFAFGSFKVTSRLVMPTRRWDYTQCHKFKTPVILCYDRGRDLMEFAEMANVAVVLNLEHGRALSHGQECKPFFPAREATNYLGVPMLHYLEEHFGEAQEFTDSVTTYGLRWTPFSVTAESDGRFGRVYMKAEDARRFGVKLTT